MGSCCPMTRKSGWWFLLPSRLCIWSLYEYLPTWRAMWLAGSTRQWRPPWRRRERKRPRSTTERANSSWGYGNRMKRTRKENQRIHRGDQEPWTTGLSPVKTVYSSCLAWPALPSSLPWMWGSRGSHPGDKTAWDLGSWGNRRDLSHCYSLRKAFLLKFYFTQL